jgi:replicative DNA helicase
VDEVPSAHNLTYYTGPVIEAWRKRKIIDGCKAVYDRGQADGLTADDLLSEAESLIYGQEVTGVPTLDGKQAGDEMIEDLEYRFHLQGKLSGLETGFKKFDELTDGLQPGEQTIIGARPSQGKTAISLNILEKVCFREKIPTVFVTLEMSTKALMKRLASSWTSIPMSTIRKGSYSQQDFQKLTAFRSMTAKAPIWFVNGVGGMGIGQLCSAVRRRVKKDKAKFVIIDYLQKIKASEKKEKHTYEVGEVSNRLKALAVSTGVSLLTLAQLNREPEKDKTRIPRLADLADSGQIERDGDTVALLHRDKTTVGKSYLIVAKQRDGDTGSVELYFNKTFCRFEDV